MSSRDNALDRRAFLGLTALAGGALAASGVARGEERPDAASVVSSPPKAAPYRYWIYGCGTTPAETAPQMKEMGFHVVVGGDAKAIEAVTAAGMESWLCGGAFGAAAEDTANLACDIQGTPQPWFGSGSPNSPVLREKNLKSYEEMAKTPGVTGILVDGCRFASPASGLLPFLSDFSEHSQKKALSLGFDWEGMKRDVAALHATLTGQAGDLRKLGVWLRSPIGVVEWLTAHPGVIEWLRFRRTCITEHFRAIHDVLHGAGKKMGVYIFTPSFAPLVGQSYADLAEFVDVFCPMIYRNYHERPGIACLNWELTIIPEELGVVGSADEALVMEAVLALTGLSTAVTARKVRHIQTATPPESVAHETAMARALLPENKELAPIVHIDDPQMGETADGVRRAGADGIAFFLYQDNWKALVGPAFG